MKKLSESVWADIHRRSNGTQERKEDNINNLDIDELFKYINEKYWINLAGHKMRKYDITRGICVPIYVRENSAETVKIDLDYGFNSNPNSIFIEENKPYFQKYNISIYDKLNDAFNLNPINVIQIYPKGNEPITNKFFIDVLEFLIDNVDEPFKNILIHR